MPRPTNPRKREAERKFPHRVDIVVPEGSWDHHGFSERKPGEVPTDYVRFYFASAEDVERFRARWAT